jgi:hypothetical protein
MDYQVLPASLTPLQVHLRKFKPISTPKLPNWRGRIQSNKDVLGDKTTHHDAQTFNSHTLPFMSADERFVEGSCNEVSVKDGIALPISGAEVLLLDQVLSRCRKKITSTPKMPNGNK